MESDIISICSKLLIFSVCKDISRQILFFIAMPIKMLCLLIPREKMYASHLSESPKGNNYVLDAIRLNRWPPHTNPVFDSCVFPLRKKRLGWVLGLANDPLQT